MRSPKSPAASLYTEPADSSRTPHASDEHRRLRVAALRSVPLSVARDIIQHEPKDSYRNIQFERDRRLRLTIRRYVNQIQYGCLNRNCATITCLSYRRRHSKTPVRQYTDTSARALACHLVDEASRNRQDPALGFCPNQPVVPWYQDPRTTQERRAPVATTPSRQSRHSANGTVRGPQEKRLSTTSHPVNGSPGRSRNSAEQKDGAMGTGADQASPVMNSQPHSRRPSRNVPIHRAEQDSNSTTDPRDTAKDLSDGHDSTPRKPIRNNEEIIAHREVDGRVKYLVVWREGIDAKMAWSTEGTIQNTDIVATYKNEHGEADALDSDQLANLEAALDVMPITMIEDQVEDLPDTKPRQHEGSDTPSTPRIDFASFTQTLWNTLTLRNLDSHKEPKEDKRPKHDQRSLEIDEVEYEDDSINVMRSEIKTNVLSNTAFRGFTLRRLSWDNLGWLMDATKDKHLARGSPFETFIMQSVHHNIGNPNRLLDSADLWHWSEMEDSDDDSASNSSQESGSPRDAMKVRRFSNALTRQSRTDSEQQMLPFDAESTMTAFQSIEGLLDGTDVLFDALYDTLQQCYSVDHPTYGGSKEAQLARRAFKGLGGGFYDPSGNTVATRGYSIQQTGQLPDQSQISRILFLALIALVTPLFNYRWQHEGFDSIGFITIADLRGDNKAGFNAQRRNEATKQERKTLKVLTEVLDHLHDWHRCRLASALTDCISHHAAAAELRRVKSHPRTKPENVIHDALTLLQRDFEQRREGACNDVRFRLMTAMGIIDIARTVLLRDWDRAPTVPRTGSVGGALELLSALYHRFSVFDLGESSHVFEMPFIAAAFDDMELPNDWLDFAPNSQQYHILSYPFLFETATLVRYFRAINITAMKSSYETASMVFTDAYTHLHSSQIPVYGGRDILQSMRPYMAKYLVLTVRRSHLLEDAINQLWRRQRREILRPLRVRLGREEGEDGLDYGGVQQEFFRLIFAEAFNPDHGMFTVDERTKISWFLPGSQEPLWRFEAIGLLMGIAVYNCVNLPINMPLAFYRKLLGFKVSKLEHIKDGWPDLEKGLRQLLEYDGDVAEDIGRTYEFSYEFGGKIFTKDISRNAHRRAAVSLPPIGPSRKSKEKAKSPTFELPLALSPPPPVQQFSPSASPDIDTGTSDTSSPIPAIDSGVSISTPLSTPSPSLAPVSPSNNSAGVSSQEPPLVTNATRERYIKDYITHLTDYSVAPQYSAFIRGLHAALHPQALHLFTPTQLRDLIEGERTINIDDLERHANYEDFEQGDPYVSGFWDVVREETSKDQTWAGQLLEFVLASARVPVGGWGSAQGRGSFVVQKNGDEWVDETELRAAVAQVDGPTDAGERWSEPLATPATAGAIPAVVTVTTDDDGPSFPAAAEAAAADGDADAGADSDVSSLAEQPAARSHKPYRARLPSSSTCYARLLLPRYHVVGEDEDGAGGVEPGTKWKEVLRERLKKAVAEGRGFGML